MQYLLDGIQNGFRFGFDYSQYQCRKTKCNMLSARQNSCRGSDRVFREGVSFRKMIGPLKKGSIDTHINRFGVIPKPHQPGKWQLIVDLSYPEGGSVNAGINPNLCSLTYKSGDNAVCIITRKGRGTLLAKLDLESAYRIVPVHPDDRHLLGMEWEDSLYIDTTLPFGLQSAPKIFNALADALLWIMGHNGVCSALH